MEMRGHGTIFGADQSGAKDVGLDLQAAILEKAVGSLNKEFVLSIPDTRVAIGCELQRYGERQLKEVLPSTRELSAVSRWEAKLAEAVIDKWYGAATVTSDIDENNSAVNEQTAATKTTKARAASGKGKGMRGKGKTEALRKFLASGTTAELRDLHDEWEKHLKVVRCD
jgi:hypothetical protein